MYVTGDTMPIPDLEDVGKRGPVDTAVVHVGGTRLPAGVTVTMTGPDAVKCLRLVQPRAAIPVHY